MLQRGRVDRARRRPTLGETCWAKLTVPLVAATREAPRMVARPEQIPRPQSPPPGEQPLESCQVLFKKFLGCVLLIRCHRVASPHA